MERIIKRETEGDWKLNFLLIYAPFKLKHKGQRCSIQKEGILSYR